MKRVVEGADPYRGCPRFRQSRNAARTLAARGHSRGAKTDPFSLRARQAGASWKPQGFCFMFAQDGSPRASTPTMRPRRASFFSLHHWGRGTAPAVEGVRRIHPANCKGNRCIPVRRIISRRRPSNSNETDFFGCFYKRHSISASPKNTLCPFSGVHGSRKASASCFKVPTVL